MAFDLSEWLNLALRWLHLTAGIAWIGSSFYFVWLDNHLKAPAEGEASGELWSVHGGGFYHNQKYQVAPSAMPEQLHWFKWEAYFTWISGFSLLVLIYYVGAQSFLIDPAKAALSPAAAIAIGLAAQALGWLVYDRLCRSPAGVQQSGARRLVVHRPAVCRRRARQPVQRARGLSARRGDDRHGDGRQRVLHHHSQPAQGRRRSDRRAHSRSGAGRGGQAALAAQQLHDAAGAVHHDQQSLSDDLWRRAAVAGARLARADRRGRPPCLQPARPRPADGLDDRPGGGARARQRHLCHAGERRARRSRRPAQAVTYAEIQPILATHCAACHSTHPANPAFPRRRSAWRSTATSMSAPRRRGSRRWRSIPR